MAFTIPDIYIYALLDPETMACRYVGKSSRPVGRLKAHMYEAKKGYPSHKLAWIRSLGEHQPLLQILEYVGVTEDNWQERERWWIVEMRRRNCDLTNATPGGEGVPVGTRHTAEAKTKISLSLIGNTRTLGKRVSSETREKHRLAMLGNTHAKGGLGRKHPPAVVAKRAAAIRASGQSERMRLWWANRRTGGCSDSVHNT